MDHDSKIQDLNLNIQVAQQIGCYINILKRKGSYKLQRDFLVQLTRKTRFNNLGLESKYIDRAINQTLLYD